MRFEFATATKIVFGPGTLREAASLAREWGDRAFVVTGSNSQRVQPLLAALEQHKIATTTFRVSGEPTIAVVQEGIALAKTVKPSLVLGFGGGSALDAGKAIAAMLTNGGDLLDYVEVIGRGKSLQEPSLPFIAIPTTAGTGSEVTRNAVLGSPEHRVKVSLRSAYMLPRIALVDPELTLDMPRVVTANSGLDALTQLIEPYVCSRANPVTDVLCLEGISRAARSLRTVCENGQDLFAREDMAMASLLGGLALANSGLGAVHGFANPIGGMFSAPHGAICAALLPHVMEMNIDAAKKRDTGGKVLKRFDEVAQLLIHNRKASAIDGIQWIRQLVVDLKIPGLRSYGIQSEDFAVLVEKAMQASSMKANPILLTSDELREVLQRAL